MHPSDCASILYIEKNAPTQLTRLASRTADVYARYKPTTSGRVHCGYAYADDGQLSEVRIPELHIYLLYHREKYAPVASPLEPSWE